MRRRLAALLLALAAVLVAAAPASAADSASKVPVIVIVFDEFPSTSLMDADGQIDPVRYPGFASLARTATWFRNATTVADGTQYAVPAIIGSVLPRRRAIPAIDDYPQNLFTALAPSHTLHVTEPATRLCPVRLCGVRAGAATLTATSAALSDCPASQCDAPLQQASPLTAKRRARLQALRPLVEEAKAGEVVHPGLPRFIRSLQRWNGAGRAPFYFLHVLQPHQPWLTLPDGRRYASPFPTNPGLINNRWVKQPELAQRAQQRHLLQVGAVDRQLRILLAKLRATGLYDRSLILMTADHGVAFEPGQPRREINSAILGAIAPVTLFVKLPGQTEGLVDDRAAHTVDVLPTVAAALGIHLTRPVAGRSLYSVADALAGANIDVYKTYSTANYGVTRAPLEVALSQRRTLLAEQVARFGARTSWSRVFTAIGPRPDLIGRRVSSLRVASGGGGAVFDGARTGPCPCSRAMVTGRLSGARAGAVVVIAFGGRIEAVTGTFTFGGVRRFAALVPDDAARGRPALYVLRGGGLRRVAT